MLSIGRSLPFALALGVSRRSYYIGTALLAVALAAVYGLALTVLQVIERATGGWGVGLHFFRVPYILTGPWYLTWLTSFVRAGPDVRLRHVVRARLPALEPGRPARLHRRPGRGRARRRDRGVTRAHAWAGVGHFFTTLSAAGLTGLLAALAAALLAGGYATMRRVTV